MTPLEERDYTWAIGKKISGFIDENYKPVVGVIKEIDYSLGLTIMAEKGEEYLYCLIGPSAPNWEGPGTKAELLAHKRNFFYLLACARKGTFSNEIATKIDHSCGFLFSGDDPSAASCPFSQ